jgi:fatty acid amide hydrolase
MVHYPVGTVPVAVVADDEQDYFAAEGPCVRDRFSKFAHAALQGSAGLPFAVQVAALPFHDELVLRVMRELERDGIGRAGVPPAANL